MTRHRGRDRLSIADPSVLPSGRLSDELSRVYGIISAEPWNHSDEVMIIELFGILEMLPKYAEKCKSDQMCLSSIYIDDINKRIKKILWWNEGLITAAKEKMKQDRILDAERFIDRIIGDPIKAQRRAVTYASDAVLSYISIGTCPSELRELVLMERENRNGTYRMMKAMSDKDLIDFSKKDVVLSEHMKRCIAEALQAREEARQSAREAAHPDRHNYPSPRYYPSLDTEWWREQD